MCSVDEIHVYCPVIIAPLCLSDANGVKDEFIAKVAAFKDHRVKVIEDRRTTSKDAGDEYVTLTVIMKKSKKMNKATK